MPTTRRRRRGAYGNSADAQLVAQVRERLGITQGTVAAALGITQGAVAQIEGQDRPLNRAMRLSLERLAAEHDAVRLAARVADRGALSALDCPAQASETAEAYIAHLGTCPKCLAKAAVTRTSRAIRERGR